MVLLAPLVYTMHYLKKTNQLSAQAEKDGYEFVWKGFNNMQRFKNTDGSYSVFEGSPSSTWLTAFVAKVFCKATEFIPIPANDIGMAIEWLIKQQSSSGKFIDYYRVHSNTIAGGLNGDLTLSAYVLITLMECNQYNSATKKAAIQKAITYLERNIQHTKQPYNLAIVAYALSLTESGRRYDVNEELKSMAKYIPVSNVRFWNWNTSEFGTGNVPWIYQKKPNAVAVETTSYALLAQLQFDDFDYSHPIVNWLTRQRSSAGAFVSTQDTVITLQALTEYSSKSKIPLVDIFCNVSNTETTRLQKRSVQITKDRAQNVEVIEDKMEGNYLTPPLSPSIKTPKDATEEVATTLKLSEEQRELLLQELDKCDLDPVLVVKKRNNWNPPANVQVTADNILDSIATWGMPPNKRRDAWDGAYRWLFHFASVTEIAQCRKEMANIYPYAFGHSQRMNAMFGPAGNVFGDVMVVNKTGARDDDAFLYDFFTSC